jgi:hypothetical protein
MPGCSFTSPVHVVLVDPHGGPLPRRAECTRLVERAAVFKESAGAYAPQTKFTDRTSNILIITMFQTISPSQAQGANLPQPDIQQQIAALQALQLQQLQQQQMFPLGGIAAAFSTPVSTSQQPAASTSPVAGGVTNVKVVIDRRNTFALGFTPFKYSIADCKAGRIPFDFRSLMDQIKFAESSGGLPVQAVGQNGIADTAGLRPWDVIIGVNNVDVRGYGGQQTIDVIKQLPPGTPLELLVLRSSNPPAPVVVRKIPSFADILCCGGGD